MKFYVQVRTEISIVDLADIIALTHEKMAGKY
jgi:hypothetical protein